TRTPLATAAKKWGEKAEWNRSEALRRSLAPAAAGSPPFPVISTQLPPPSTLRKMPLEVLARTTWLSGFAAMACTGRRAKLGFRSFQFAPAAGDLRMATAGPPRPAAAHIVALGAL